MNLMPLHVAHELRAVNNQQALRGAKLDIQKILFNAQCAYDGGVPVYYPN